MECLSDTELREEVASNSDVVYYTQQLRDAVHIGELVGGLSGAPKPAQLGPGDWTVVESDCDAENADEDPVDGGLVIRSNGSFRGRLGGLELSGSWDVPEGEPIVLVDDELGPLFATFEQGELSIGLDLGDAPVRYQLRRTSP